VRASAAPDGQSGADGGMPDGNIMSPAHPALSAYVVRRLTLDTDPYLSCDDCFDMVDGYGEALLSDHDLPAMRTHLAGCAACAEEALPHLAGHRAGRSGCRRRTAADPGRPGLNRAPRVDSGPLCPVNLHPVAGRRLETVQVESFELAPACLLPGDSLEVDFRTFRPQLM